MLTCYYGEASDCYFIQMCPQMRGQKLHISVNEVKWGSINLTFTRNILLQPPLVGVVKQNRLFKTSGNKGSALWQSRHNRMEVGDTH